MWVIPGGRLGLWLCFGMGVVFNALAIYFVFAKPWTDQISTGSWQLWLGLISVVIIALGVLIFFLGNKKAKFD